MSLNRAQLIGHIGREPELKYTQQGSKPVLRFSLATSDRWIDDNGNKQERTEWHTVLVWGKRAEGLAKLLHKGSRVFVEGQLRTRCWEKEGQKHYSTEINMTEIDLLSPKRDQDGGAHE